MSAGDDGAGAGAGGGPGGGRGRGGRGDQSAKMLTGRGRVAGPEAGGGRSGASGAPDLSGLLCGQARAGGAGVVGGKAQAAGELPSGDVANVVEDATWRQATLACGGGSGLPSMAVSQGGEEAERILERGGRLRTPCWEGPLLPRDAALALTARGGERERGFSL